MVDINDILAWPIAIGRQFVVWSVSPNGERVEIAEIVGGVLSTVEAITISEALSALVVGKWINEQAHICLPPTSEVQP